MTPALVIMDSYPNILTRYRNNTPSRSKDTSSFARINELIQSLDGVDLTNSDISETKNLFQSRLRTVRSPFHSYEDFCLYFHFLSLGVSANIKECVYEHNILLKKLRMNLGWIEKTFNIPTNWAANTYYMPAALDGTRSKNDTAGTIYNIDAENSVPIFANLIDEIFETLSVYFYDKGNVEFRGGIGGLRKHSLDEHRRDRFNNLVGITKEISQNALNHALNHNKNKHAKNYRGTNFFGELFLFQIGRFLAHQSTSSDRLDNFRYNFGSYFSNYKDFSASLDGKFWVLRFFDTGPGIVKHIIEFLPDSSLVDASVDIQKVIRSHISTRMFSGSGYGFENVLTLVKYLEGYLSINSAGDSYSYDGISGEENIGHSTLARGTEISIIFPIQ